MPKSDLPRLVFDIHGVLIGRREPPGHRPPGVVLDELRARGFPLRFLTNASSVSPQMLVEQLAGVGVRARPSEVYTAAGTVAHYLRSRPEPSRLYVIGSAVLRAEIDGVCGSRVQWVPPEHADTVVISRDPGLTDAVLERLTGAARPRLIATCRDAQFPNGAVLDAGPGATVQRVEAALGCPAWVIGKPNPYVLTTVMGLGPDQLADTVVIGDSPEQDVALCKYVGACSVLLQNEPVSPELKSAPDRATDLVPDRAGAAGRPPFPQPDHAIRAIDQLLSLLQVTA